MSQKNPTNLNLYQFKNSLTELETNRLLCSYTTTSNAIHLIFFLVQSKIITVKTISLHTKWNHIKEKKYMKLPSLFIRPVYEAGSARHTLNWDVDNMRNHSYLHGEAAKMLLFPAYILTLKILMQALIIHNSFLVEWYYALQGNH